MTPATAPAGQGPGRTVVVTGCSTGFGRATALRLAGAGWQVFATVRREADRASLFEAARAAGVSAGPRVLLCDVTDAAQVRALAERVCAATGRLDGLVNNAGTAYPGPLELLPADDLRAQLELNVVAQHAVTQALLPLLRRARGTIVNVSSQGGRVAFPVHGAYSASKFALEALSDALRVELAPFGVKVVVVQPGASPTAIWGTGMQRGRDLLAQRVEAAGPYAPLVRAVEARAERSAAQGFAPEAFAALIERILLSRRPRARYQIPRRVALIALARSLLPDEAWDWVVRRMLGW